MRAFVVSAVALSTVSLYGCGGGDEGGGDDAPTTTEPQGPTEGPTEGPTKGPTEAPSAAGCGKAITVSLDPLGTIGCVEAELPMSATCCTAVKAVPSYINMTMDMENSAKQLQEPVKKVCDACSDDEMAEDIKAGFQQVCAGEMPAPPTLFFDRMNPLKMLKSSKLFANLELVGTSTDDKCPTAETSCALKMAEPGTSNFIGLVLPDVGTACCTSLTTMLEAVPAPPDEAQISEACTSCKESQNMLVQMVVSGALGPDMNFCSPTSTAVV